MYIYIYIFWNKKVHEEICIFKFIYFVLTYVLYIHIFPACCFHQRTYVTQGLVNGVLNETRPHSCFQYKWPLVGQACLYRGCCPSFLECVHFGLLYPSLIFDMFRHTESNDSNLVPWKYCCNINIIQVKKKKV